MHRSPDSVFNFEEWSLLAKTDPLGFEARREQEITNLIAKAPSRTQARLQGLQWKIDVERRRANTPLAACERIFDQMWASVYGVGGLLEALAGIDSHSVPERPLAAVLNFHPKRFDQQRNPLPYPPSPHS
jgi:hypothetical protein